MYGLYNMSNIKPNIIKKITLLNRPRGNNRTKKKLRKYKNVITAFDIETTRITQFMPIEKYEKNKETGELIAKKEEATIMYHWQFAVGTHTVITGRTWDEFLAMCKYITSQLESEETVVIYVWNLSYEFQFLSGIYYFQPEEVFAVKSRKILKCTMFDEKLEFRDAYLQTNMSLAVACNKFNVEHGKLSGELFDYNKLRFPWTPLTEYEVHYCINDVLATVEIIETELKRDMDTLYTIPLTSTGYVRRDAKQVMRSVNKTWLKSLMPNYEVYKLLREAFRGGDTHASRFFVGKLLQGVFSKDRSSSYPGVQCNGLYPVEPFKYKGEIEPKEFYKYLQNNRAMVFRCTIYNVRIKDGFPDPYLSRSKCRATQNGVYDNGRILYADYTETTVTDIDFKILIQEYDFDEIDFYDVYISKYGKLPKPLIELNKMYYKNKTELKNVEGQEIYYNKNKNLLNSIYGMSAQDPVKQSIDYIYGTGFVEREEAENKLLDSYNEKAFLPYQWGVWTTANARYELHEGIWLNPDAWVYGDTDSNKFITDVDFTEYNNRKMKQSTESGAYATDKFGVTHFMEIYENDGYYDNFITLGAKRYAYTEKGKPQTHITVSGVQKKKGGAEIDAHGGITAFRDGFIFRDAGRLETVYSDNPITKQIRIENHDIEITSNVTLRPTTYNMSLTDEYKNLLANLS